ncbi:MAG TPA: helix-turn-helix transcriptional regulator [Xanthomonadales bacterium]|nr:helix-turn-helix transcriptional regulator [Xanthomonadales bacterium]
MDTHAATTNRPQPVGHLIRDWRQRRRLTQLDLACDAEISTRHLSFLETGRAKPSREMVLHLTELLDVPLRERNALLVAAGFAPVFRERALDDPAMAKARDALQIVLGAHEPYPAIVVDRHWNLRMANRAAHRLLAGIPPDKLASPVNVLRLSLEPDGLAQHIVNLGEWRAHLLARLRSQVATSGDATLRALHEELAALPPLPGEVRDPPSTPFPDVVVRLHMRTPLGELALFSTITVFGTPVDVTLSELALEAFYPADEATGASLRAMAAADP